MAIQKNMVTEQGFDVANAYIRIEAICHQTKTKIGFFIRCYKQAEGVTAFYQEATNCEYDINGENPYVQAYKFIKTLPQYAGAVDC